jgi:N-acetylglucosamine kinase-like BadF-type ATPase
VTFLGVDGGGTKTQLVCIDAQGHELASVTVNSTYHPEVGLAEVLRRLEQGVATVCTQAAVTPGALSHVFFGLPAYGEDRLIDPQLHAACGAMLGHGRYTCDNDMVCGWAGSLGCEDGINIVAGTGSIGYGQHGGRSARAGGWGEVFSDEGSAYWIALRGLTIFSRMSDGRLPKGPLHQRMVSALALKDDLDLCEWVMGSPPRTRAEIAGLAPLVSAAAEEGDAEANAILESAAQHLASIAGAVRTTLEFPSDVATPLSWSGSILKNVALVQSRFITIVQANGFHLVSPRHPPGYGAALYARKLFEIGAGDSCE